MIGLDYLIDICDEALVCATTCRNCEGPLTLGVCLRCAVRGCVCEDDPEEEYIPYAFRALNEMDGYGLKESDFH
jgi:hypothetical protein